MRKLAFRAWDKETRRFYWNVWVAQGIVWIAIDGDGEKTTIVPKPELKPDEYTGLKDRNGKEIYHFDVLEITFPNGEKIKGKVIEDFASWQIEGGGMLSNFKEDWIEVIGNIHEHPKFLERNENKNLTGDSQ